MGVVSVRTRFEPLMFSEETEVGKPFVVTENLLVAGY
jgi:hypothetical protein